MTTFLAAMLVVVTALQMASYHKLTRRHREMQKHMAVLTKVVADLNWDVELLRNSADAAWGLEGTSWSGPWRR